jgi:hypothetical protein
VIADGLRLLKAGEEGMEALRREITRGVVDIQQGRFTAFATDAELEALSDEIISAGHRVRALPVRQIKSR